MPEGAAHPGPTTGVVVTGGASGIGLATAHALVAVGRPVALWDLGAERVRAAADAVAEAVAEGVRGAAAAPASVPVPVVGLVADVTDDAQVADALARSRAALGTIGGLVHAAGNVIPETIDRVDWGHWDLQLDVHLNAYARLVQAVLPDLRQHAGSAIVAVSSIMGVIGSTINPAYGAAKAGVLGLNRSMAARLGPWGIRVNAVCPGYIDTPMMAPLLERDDLRATLVASSSLRRLGRPEEIATAIRFLLGDDASFVTGQALIADGGVTATA